MLSKSDLQLPETGWGELLVSQTAPVAGGAWTEQVLGATGDSSSSAVGETFVMCRVHRR